MARRSRSFSASCKIRQPDDWDTWDIVEPICDALETRYHTDPRLHLLNPGQKALFAISWTYFEICNGGLYQYFTNATGFLAPEFIEGARLVGAVRHAKLMERAVALAGGMDSIRDFDHRAAAIRSLSPEKEEELDDLTRAFYDLDTPKSPEHLDGLAEQYVRNHPAEFFLE